MSHLVHPAANLGDVEPVETLPPEIEFDEDTMVCSLACHPREPLLVAGLTDGSLHVYRYGIHVADRVARKPLHRDACRDLAFAPSGASVVSVAADRRIRRYDLEAGRVSFDCRQSQHRTPVNRVCFWSENRFLTGDDAGLIIMWDARTALPTAVIKEDVDQITSLTLDADSYYCYSTSLDGCVTIIDVRSRRRDPVVNVIGPLKTALNCVGLLRDGAYIAVGAATGDLLMWQHGKWSSAMANIKGHPGEVQCMLPAGDDHVLTGSADGVIRHIRLMPDTDRSFDQVVAMHEDAGLDVLLNFGIETMQYTHDRQWLAYSAHDYCIHWADVSALGCGAPAAPTVTPKRRRPPRVVPEPPAPEPPPPPAPVDRWYTRDEEASEVATAATVAVTDATPKAPDDDAEEGSDAEEEEDSDADSSGAASDRSADRPRKKKRAVRKLRVGRFFATRREFFTNLQ